LPGTRIENHPRRTVTTNLKAGSPNPSVGGHLPALDGLRAIAILAVLLFHDDHLIPGGYLGVDLFFVLSGFLITSILLDEHRRTGRLDFGRFYVRRALRLFPALVVLLAFGLTFAIAFPRAPQSAHILRGVGYSLCYAANWATSRDPQFLGPLGHTWSLAVEEQFYLIWPPILFLTLRASRSRRTLLLTTLSMATISALWRLALSLHGATPWRLYVGTDTRADALLIGCATAIALANRRFASFASNSRVPRYLAVGGAILITWLMKGTPLEWRGYDRGMFFVVSVSTACILVVVVTQRGWGPVVVLSQPILAWIGRLSYSLYLWHLPLFGFIKSERFSMAPTTVRTLRIALTFVVAAGSYYLIERPFLRLKSRLRRN
jgi:peptidoglycan/LPS O-acetylase OafA/YrhL